MGRATPIRVAAIELGRQGDGYPRLLPVPVSWDLTVVEVAGAGDGIGGVADRYVRSVWLTWKRIHGPQIEDWQQATSRRMAGP